MILFAKHSMTPSPVRPALPEKLQEVPVDLHYIGISVWEDKFVSCVTASWIKKTGE